MKDGSGQGRGPASHEVGPRPRPLATLLVLALCAALACAGFVALGTWQLQRLQWKLALIDRVEQRVHAAPVPAPGLDHWPRITAESDEYRHVQVIGTFLHQQSTLVQAATVLGSGYWLMTPLRRPDGTIVLVNRGFISADAADLLRREVRNGTAGREQAATITGLLRISEPGGAFLHQNDPAADRWYSRDVPAIAAARSLRQVAPYFIDADAAPERDVQPGEIVPVGGLTVVSFHNSHLVYALTWYALAVMVAAAGLWIWREERRLRRAG
ncbi:MAG TPA: SURF1 family protein [Noviherbaspirillum sp.]|nr:SURF1 family protein [Noviherbaspirillum sp.]